MCIIGLVACRPKSLVRERVVYGFLNEWLAKGEPFGNDKVYCVTDKNLDSLIYTAEDSTLLLTMDTIFTPEDISFIIKQLKNANDFNLRQELLTGRGSSLRIR